MPIKCLLLEIVHKYYLSNFIWHLCVYIVPIFWEIVYLYPDSGTDKYVKGAIIRSGSTEQSHKIEINYLAWGLRLINLILNNFFLLQFCICFSNEKKIMIQYFQSWRTPWRFSACIKLVNRLWIAVTTVVKEVMCDKGTVLNSLE